MKHFLSRFPQILTITLLSTLLAMGLWMLLPCTSGEAQAETGNTIPMRELASRVKVGDLIFIRIPNRLFLKVSEGSGSWTNHVGIVIDTSGSEPLVAESRVPRASADSLSKFIDRSANGRAAVRRLPRELSAAEQQTLGQAARKRFGSLYDLGFDLHSSRQFCSKYVREVLAEASGELVGEPENFARLLARHPDTDQRFWKWWFHGNIPWQRETITPASQYESPKLSTVFDGRVVADSK